MDDARIVELTEAAAAGDRGALEALLVEHMDVLRAFISRRARPVLLALEAPDDLAQSVCREVLAHATKFSHPIDGAFRRWLFKMALRKMQHRTDYHLADRRDARRTERIGDANSLALSATSSHTPSLDAMLAEVQARLESAVAALPDDLRQMFELSRVEGRTRAQIAAIVGRTEGAVRMALHRALASIAAHLADQADLRRS